MSLEEPGLLLLEKPDRKPPKFKEYLPPNVEEEEECTNSLKKLNGLTLKNKIKNIILYSLNMLNKKKLLLL
jgi:hypothetical protein